MDTLPRGLGDGLVLRRAVTEADVEAIIGLYNQVLMEGGANDIGDWVRLVVDGSHPTMKIGDFYLVEDGAGGRVVSSMCVIPQTWAYGGVPFRVGRPETVATLEDYRRRGLVRAQFAAVHADCAARGLAVQAITGIPYFYRLFGYDYALPLDDFVRVRPAAAPRLQEGEPEPYTLRPATEADLPLMRRCHDRFTASCLVACERSEAEWRYRMRGPKRLASATFYVIEGGGYCAVEDIVWGNELFIYELFLDEGVPYLAVLPALLRALRGMAEARESARDKPIDYLRFHEVSPHHPAYAALLRYGGQPRQTQYAWYVRVPDLPGFVRQIKPVLERRLARSSAAGFSGDIKLGFYREPGLRLKFDQGKLVKVRAVAVEDEEDLQGRFPPGVFLKLLFGYRSLKELNAMFPDAFANLDSWLVLEALFPKQPSWVDGLM